MLISNCSNDTERETDVLQKLLPHQNVRYFESWQENRRCQKWNKYIKTGPEKYAFILMEFCSGGNLRLYLSQNIDPKKLSGLP